MKTCFDYGHGGKDSGALGYGLREKDIVLSVGNKATKILEQHNVEVVHTRTSDVFVELHERAGIANKANTDVFVSLHCNAFSDANAQGVEVFSYPNSVEGKRLSQSILDGIVSDKLYTKNRGLKTANFAVLKRTKMPSCLVELGFITNAEDVVILKAKQDELALAVAKGILAHLGVIYKEAIIKNDVDPYPAALKTLAEQNIIGTLDAWKDPSKIKSDHARALIIKVADYINQGI